MRKSLEPEHGDPKPEEAAAAAPPLILSMTDEERDIEVFRAYLHTVPPDALWDILSHLDEELFPRRAEAVKREIGRRRLFFISPYTAFEQRLRMLFGGSVGLSVLAAFLHALAGVDIPLEPGEHLSWFFDLAVGGPAAARIALFPAQFATVVGGALTVGAVVLCGWLLAKRRLRRDVLVQGVVAVGLIVGFGWLAGVRSSHMVF